MCREKNVLPRPHDVFVAVNFSIKQTGETLAVNDQYKVVKRKNEDTILKYV